MQFRLIIALTLSLVLHGSLLLTDALKSSPPPAAPVLRASLRQPPEPPPLPETPPQVETDPLVKNTLDEEAPEKKPPEPPPPREKKAPPNKNKTSLQREIQSFQKKLSKYIFYPEQARKLGLEGTVELFVELAEDGSVRDIRVVSSSGFPILDNAAIKGFYAVGAVPGKSDIWSYTFQLE